MSAAPTGFALIRAAYDIDGLDEHERAVIVLLAVMANAEGRAWPSIAYLSEKTGASRRTVQAAAKRLEDAGHITRREVPGRGMDYTVHPVTTPTRAGDAPVQDMHPCTGRTRAGDARTRAPRAPKQPRNNHDIIDATASIVEDAQIEPDQPPLGEEPETAKPEHFVEAWNALATRLGKPTIRTLTPERRQKLKARLAEYPIDDFKAVLANIERSQFLRSGRFLTFDWIIGKANFLKVLEGNYNR